MVGNGKFLPIASIGKGPLPTPHAKFHLTKVLHTSAIAHNLLSIFQIAKDNNCSLTFNSSGYVMQENQSHQILFQGPWQQEPVAFLSNKTLPLSLVTFWHQRLGHPSFPFFLGFNKIVQLTCCQAF